MRASIRGLILLGALGVGGPADAKKPVHAPKARAHAVKPHADVEKVEGPEPFAAVAAFRNSPAQAALALARAAEANPEVAGALTILQAESQLAAGARDRARFLAVAVARSTPVFADRAYWVAARAAMPADCRAALDFLSKAPVSADWVPAPPRLALLWHAQAACDRPESDATRRALALEWPTTPEGREAATGLTLTPEERLKRAAHLEDARDYAAADADLSALLDGPVSDEARFQIGRLHLERLRDDFHLAERAFAQVAAGRSPRAVEAAWLRARALGRAGDVAAAAAAYDTFLTEHATAPQAADARFFRAFLDYENGRLAQAAAGFAAIIDGPFAPQARWYAAFTRYLADSPAAVAALDALAADNADGKAARRARYWAARAREHTAPAEARRRLLAVQREAPLDWYGLLVRRRLADRAGAGALGDVPGLPKAPAHRPQVAAPKRLRAVALQVRSLARAGLHDFARRVVNAAWNDLHAPETRPLAVDLAATAQDFGRIYGSTQAWNRAALEAAPTGGAPTMLRDAWPMGFPEALHTAARAGLAPSHLAAFILKESGFNPDAVSAAHALGLMQLMEPTARAIGLARGGASGAALPDLFDPDVNIDLGGWYLGALSQRFGGQLPLVAAAYNAGPPSVVGWFKGRSTVDTDVFVEAIPFRETREYVKRIVELHTIYQLVHDGKTLSRAVQTLPEQLDLTVRPGVDF